MYGGIQVARTSSLLMAATIALISFALAQEPIDEVEVEGAISSVSTTSIELLDGLVTILTEGAVVEGEESEKNFELSDLRVGMAVEVQGKPGTGGMIDAIRITVEDDEPEHEIEGRVDRVDPGTKQFSIAGLRIHWNAETEFEKKANLAVGQKIEVELKSSADQLIAKEISSEDDP